MYNFKNYKKQDKPYKFVTLSFDDCVLQDERFIEIINKYGLLCTFNLNSGLFGQHDVLPIPHYPTDHSHIPADRVKEVYNGHEVAAHSRNHPRLDFLNYEGLVDEIGGDVRCIEELSGQKVIGMAYPGGPYYNDFVIKTITDLTDIFYARNVRHTNGFELPKKEELMDWCPTCHIKDAVVYDLAEQFAKAEPENDMLFYIWGHTYEMDIDDYWQELEKRIKIISEIPGITPATNGEIATYIKENR